MPSRTLIPSLVLAAAFSLQPPAVLAGGDDAATIRERLKAASASVHSVVIDMEMSAPGATMSNTVRTVNILMTVVAPARAKAIAVIGPIRVESYQVDGTMYVHVQPGDSWRKLSSDPAHPPAQVLDIMHAAKNEQIAILPDRHDDGVIVGVVQIEMQIPVPAGTASVGPPVALTCSYDKTTYRMRTCANATMSMTFAKYDDPSNTVDLPAAAASAVLIVTKTPAPDVSPSAAPAATATPSAQPAPEATPAATPAAGGVPSRMPTPAASSTP